MSYHVVLKSDKNLFEKSVNVYFLLIKIYKATFKND